MSEAALQIYGEGVAVPRRNGELAFYYLAEGRSS